MTDHALDGGARTAPPTALMIAAAAGGVILVAGAVTAGAAVQVIALLLAVIATGVIVWRPEWGVFILTSTFFLSYPDAFVQSGSFTINNVVGLLLAGVLAVRSLIARRLDVLESSIVQGLLAVWVLLFLNRLVADATPPFASLKALDFTDIRATEFTSKLAFVIFVVAFIRTRWHVAVFGVSLVAFVLFTAPNASLNALGAWGAATSGNIERMRASADFGIVAARNANRLAFVCDLAIAIIGCAMLRLRWRALNVGGVAAIAGLVATIFLSASRSGVLNLFVLGAYFLTRVSVPLRRFLVGTMVAGALVLAVLQLVPGEHLPGLSSEQAVRRAVSAVAARSNIPHAYLDRITNFVMAGRGQDGVETSTQFRLELAMTGLQMFAEHPLMGVGLGNFRWKSIADYGNRHVSAMHNSYLLTLVEGGLLLLLAYFALFVITWKLLSETRRRAALRPELRLGWLVEATQVMFVMFLIFSAFADCWHEAYLAFLLALTAVLSRLYAPPPQSASA